MSGSLAANPRLDTWVRITPDGGVTIRTGKVEIGQGILTALVQIAADELDVAVERVTVLPADTTGPDEGLTAGSLSVEQSGTALRLACAQVRAIYLAEAARHLGVPVEALRVTGGTFTGPGGERTSYGELADDRLLDVPADAGAAPKPSGERAVAGHAVPRIDLPDKVFGRPRFVADLHPPGLLYGRVIRPPSPGAALAGWDGATEAAARALPGVLALVRDGSFLGVVAEREEDAIAAARRIRRLVRWSEEPLELPEDEIPRFLRESPSEVVCDERRPDPAARDRASRRLAATYSRPYVAHASIAPSCGLARWDGDTLSVWTHSQGIFSLRRDMAAVLGLPPEQILIHHAEGPGSYGHNGADDAAFDAVLLARAVPGRPVQVQWTRDDEFRCEPFGPAMTVDLEADLDAAGRIVTWRHEVWSFGHSNRPGRQEQSGLLSAAYLAEPSGPTLAIDVPLSAGGGITRNAFPGYEVGDLRVTGHRVLRMPLRTSSLRALGAGANVFAIESFMDELAALAGADPVRFRLDHLTDPRARDVVETAARSAGWGAERPLPGGDGRGMGIGYARYKGAGAYCAVIAEVEAEHEVRVRRLWVAIDVGEVVNPDGLANQLEGGAIQATSWALKERVRFGKDGVRGEDWEGYPILRFSECPAVHVDVLPRPDEPVMGAGEAAAGPTQAAIANALAHALDVRVRDLPLSAEHVVAAMEG